MAEKSLIVIGAGLAGLAAGCYAQMNGYHTRIFEQHTRPGGVCTAWKRDGYTVDGCIHWLVGARPGTLYHSLYQEVGALEDNRLLPVQHLGQFLDQVGGQCLDVTADVDRLAGDMKALSAHDGAAIDELLEGVRAFRGRNGRAPWSRVATELLTPLDRVTQAWHRHPWHKYMRLYNRPAATFAARLHDSFLRWVLSNVLAPETPILAVLTLLAQLAEGNLATVEGGSLAFALAVARRFRELGGQIVYGAPVEEILVEQRRWGDRAAGVRLANGDTYDAHAVVSAADGFSTIFRMLGGRYANGSIHRRYKTWSLFRPLVMVSYGVAHTLPGQPSLRTIRLARPLTIGAKQVDTLTCRVLDSPTLASEGKKVVQVTFETGFDHWNDLQSRDRARYEAEKSRVAAQVLDRLEKTLPGLSAHVEMIDIATPYTFWRYTGNRRGSYEGWLLTPQHTCRAVPKTLPGLKDFYMAGQWVEPGGGIPPTLYSGRQVVQILCRRDGRPFSVSTP
jgi:phytoene dehydrogenase-like protein